MDLNKRPDDMVRITTPELAQACIAEQVAAVFRNQLDANLVYVDATDRFLSLLAGVAEPEAKRKIIGAAFIRAVNTVDAMPAEVPELDWALLKKIGDRISAEVDGICRRLEARTPQRSASSF